MQFLEFGGERFHVALDGPEGAPALMLSNSLASDLAMWDRAGAERSRSISACALRRARPRPEPGPRPALFHRRARPRCAWHHAGAEHRQGRIGAVFPSGGMVGPWLAANAPERLDRVILANTSSHMAPPDIWNARIAATRKDGMAAIADTTIERWFTADFRKRAADDRRNVRAMILATPPHGYTGVCAAIRDMDQREAVRGVKKPVLVIIGTEDPATSPRWAISLAGSIPGAKSVKLDAAHLSNVEQPEAFTEAVVDFLKAIPTPR